MWLVRWSIFFFKNSIVNSGHNSMRQSSCHNSENCVEMMGRMQRNGWEGWDTWWKNVCVIVVLLYIFNNMHLFTVATSCSFVTLGNSFWRYVLALYCHQCTCLFVWYGYAVLTHWCWYEWCSSNLGLKSHECFTLLNSFLNGLVGTRPENTSMGKQLCSGNALVWLV